jgi:hypothetical protein
MGAIKVDVDHDLAAGAEPPYEKCGLEITGANRGVGLALTRIYAQRGDAVFAWQWDGQLHAW